MNRGRVSSVSTIEYYNNLNIRQWLFPSSCTGMSQKRYGPTDLLIRLVSGLIAHIPERLVNEEEYPDSSYRSLTL